MIKDKYQNNIRRGARVRDMRPESKKEGEVVGTYDKAAFVSWEPDGEEETVQGKDLLVIDRAFR